MKKIFFLLIPLLLHNAFALSQNRKNSRVHLPSFKSILKETKILSEQTGRFVVAKPYDSAIVERVTNYIQNNQQSRVSHYFLMMLAIHHPSVFQSIDDTVKTNIFCSIFSVEKNMNYWGTLSPDNQKEHNAGKLLVSLGKKILPCLLPLLNDTSRLNYGWNFDSRTTSVQYKWRKKDFAYRYAALILKETPVFLTQPKERDEVIEDFIRKYQTELNSSCQTFLNKVD
jgi:hypothetical protein